MTNLYTTETVTLPGFSPDESVLVTETLDKLIITTPDWIMEACNPLTLTIDNFAVEEFGGKENILKAFASFVRTLDENMPE